MRIDAGVTVRMLARAMGVDHAHLLRIESGLAHPSSQILVAAGVALGADLSVRYFAGTGPRIHDRSQAPMVEALVAALDARWRADLEVPIDQPSRGVIDVVLADTVSTAVVATEVSSDLRRLEQQIRWSNEKADGLAARLAMVDGAAPREVSRLLVLRSTVNNRDIANAFATILATAYPARTADVVAAITTPSAPWPGSGVIWMSVHGTKAALMRYPPPGVVLGR